MPLIIEMQDASPKVKQYIYKIPSEIGFEFPVPTENFVSNGIVTNDEFTSVLDGDPVIRSFKNMTINENHIVRPTNRCKGMFLHIAGDLTINGTLSMTARGANAPGKYVGIDPRFPFVHFNSEDTFTEYGFFVIPPTGGAGGAARVRNSGSETSYGLDGASGVAGTNGACGGGGSGGAAHQNGGTSTSGAGAAGTSFSGGAGGGGAASAGVTITAGSGGVNGGPGGNARAATTDSTNKRRACGGGAGNPGGMLQRAAPVAYSAQNGGDGAGGLIVLFVRGNIIFGTSGKIESNGVAGGYGHNAAGGGSGGGSICIFCKGTINNITKILAAGGSGGSSTGGTIPYARGGKGGDGYVGIHDWN